MVVRRTPSHLERSLQTHDKSYALLQPVVVIRSVHYSYLQMVYIKPTVDAVILTEFVQSFFSKAPTQMASSYANVSYSQSLTVEDDDDSTTCVLTGPRETGPTCLKLSPRSRYIYSIFVTR